VSHADLSLEGKVAIVTGGARGIGYAIASAMAANNANVVLVGRNKDSLEQAATTLSKDTGVQVLTVDGDVGDSATAKAAVKTCFSTFKRLDITVNNAGVLEDGLIGMIADDVIDRTLATNTRGVINFTQASARLMERNGAGSIINITSIIGRFGNAGQLVYGASKAAVIGATKSAAKELAPKRIRVNGIAPGYINTDMIKHIDEDTDRERRASIGMGRIGEPEDIANLALFLASDMSSYITGQTIGVDGCMLV